MLCKLTIHRDQGRPLKRSELAEPISGELEWMAHPNPNGRALAAVYLFKRVGVSGSASPAIPPLFDPFVRTIKDGVIVIQGTQMAPGDVELVQVWSVRPLGQPGLKERSP